MTKDVSLQSGSYGIRAVFHSAWSKEIGDFVRQEGAVELELNLAKGWHGGDVSFLAEMPGLQSFEIFDFKIKDIAPIHSLHNLRRLGITTYCSTEIKFSAFPRLESCGLEWRPKAASLFDCATLKKLFVNRYKGSDVSDFGRLASLESLAILNAPIANLLGLSPLTRLRSLRLGNLKRLTSLGGIQHLANLEELDLNTCRKIRSIEEVGDLSKLQKLYLSNDGDIESLKPLMNLTGLVSVCFPESTNILDGDLSPLFLKKSLARITFQNRRHYSHRREQFGTRYSR
jgi:Leucine-rich repeat (LRR) protein